MGIFSGYNHLTFQEELRARGSPVPKVIITANNAQNPVIINTNNASNDVADSDDSDDFETMIIDEQVLAERCLKLKARLQKKAKSEGITYEERLQAWALFTHAKISYSEISELLSLTYNQIRYAIQYPSPPLHRNAGCPPVIPANIVTELRDAIRIPCVTKRFLTPKELREAIPSLQPYSQRAIITSLYTLGAQHRQQPLRVVLSAKTRAARLEFANRWGHLSPAD